MATNRSLRPVTLYTATVPYGSSSWRSGVAIGAGLAFAAAGCSDGKPEVAAHPAPSLMRPEHPRPDFRRDTFVNLNTRWDFAQDPNDEGVAESWFSRDDVWSDEIQLPYAWESPLSGLVPPHEGAYSIADTPKATTYRGAAWYRLRYSKSLPAAPGTSWYVVFGAVDFDATVWIDGREAAHHQGGYDPFAVDLGSAASAPFSIVVRAEDRTELNDRAQPVGKQGGTWYTRTSGIWQTVYLEQRPEVYLSSLEIHPIPDESRVLVKPVLSTPTPANVRLEARLGGTLVGQTQSELEPGTELSLPLSDTERWDAEHPTLYDLDVRVIADGATAEDIVHTYFGMVEVHTDWLPGHGPAQSSDPSQQYKAFFVNGRPTYLRCVLDQSYYPRGVYTAPDVETIRADLELAKDMGFNCIRLHIKPDEPVKYRLIDEMGFYLVYDIPSLDLQAKNVPGFIGRDYFEQTMRAVMARDRNHPSLLEWVVFNENWGLMTSGSLLNPTTLAQNPDLQQWVRDMVGVARGLDPYHPVEDNSAGGVVKVFEHIDTDSNSFHYYGNDAAALRSFLDQQAAVTHPGSAENFVGGALQDGDPWWNSEIASFSTLGVSTGPEIFCDLFGIENELRRQPKLVGSVLTQLTDVEFELNGLVSYDRTPKADLCSRDGVALSDLFGSEFVAFDWLPSTTIPSGTSVAVPLLLAQWSSNDAQARSVHLQWMGGAGADQSLSLPPYAPLPLSIEVVTPANPGDATLVAELRDDQGQRTAANRITVRLE
jgi:hypothetical protein